LSKMPAVQVLVIGNPGTGKSTSWENMNPEECVIITPNAKPLPWEGSRKQYEIGRNRIMTNKLVDLPAILKTISSNFPQVKYILVDDLTHFFNARTLDPTFINRKFGNDAYAKWNELGADIFAAVAGVETELRDDLIVVYNAHTEMGDDGKVVLQTPGRLLDKTVKIDSYFTWIFHTRVIRGEMGISYKFLTNDDGECLAKTPKGAFPEQLVDNDM